MAQPLTAAILDVAHPWTAGMRLAGTVPSDGSSWKDWVENEFAPRGTSDSNYTVETVSGIKRARVATSGGLGIYHAPRNTFRLSSTPFIFYCKVAFNTTNGDGNVVQWWDTRPFGDGWALGPDGFGNLFFRSNTGSGREINTSSSTWNDNDILRGIGLWVGADGAGKIYVDDAAASSLTSGALLPATTVTSALRFTLANAGYESALLSTATRTEGQADSEITALFSDQFLPWTSGTSGSPAKRYYFTFLGSNS